jgi:protein ImuB
MPRRFVTIWFPHLKTDWFTRRQPSLAHAPFVLAIPEHGKMIISATNQPAEQQGIERGMAVADARAVFPGIIVRDDNTSLSAKLLRSFAVYCIRFTPIVATDPPDGLILDVTGCPHLWGDDQSYINTITGRLRGLGYGVKAGMADTIGAAWAITRFNSTQNVIEPSQQAKALLGLPPQCLRLEPETLDLLYKLGLRQVQSFMAMPRSSLRRRFGEHFINRLDQALGHAEEVIHPEHTPDPFSERLPCPEMILARPGIQFALQYLLNSLCARLGREQKGLRSACLKCYRVDGNIQQIEVGTHQASNNPQHLFKLFDLKIETIDPGMGIELFVLEASGIERLFPLQEKLWLENRGLNDPRFRELLDRIANKTGTGTIHRFLPDEHHWPERSVRPAVSLDEAMNFSWNKDKKRPVQLLSIPELIEVTAPIPDYPPLLFRHKGKLHTVKKADGPERIEREWWIDEGVHRDYYTVEDEEGNRYWLFRSGHYTHEKKPQWYLHGFFA